MTLPPGVVDLLIQIAVFFGIWAAISIGLIVVFSIPLFIVFVSSREIMRESSDLKEKLAKLQESNEEKLRKRINYLKEEQDGAVTFSLVIFILSGIAAAIIYLFFVFSA